MLKFILGELPAWAQPSNPLLRYELSRQQADTALRARASRIIGWSLLFAFLVLCGYAYATDWFQRPLQMPYTLDIWRMLFFPLIVLQIILRVAGISVGLSVVGGERRRQRWDKVRSTEFGAQLTLRTRWVAILFHRLRGLLVAVILSRIVLVGAVLYELTSMQGAYLDILANRSNPSLSLEMGVILLAAFMTGFILMPITATGVDVALGLLVSSRIRNRALAGILQILLIIFRVATASVLLILTLRFLNGDIELANDAALGLLGGMSLFGDWGLTLSQLTRTGQLWSEIPYTVFIGAAMLVFVLLQVAFTSLVLSISIRFAERNE